MQMQIARWNWDWMMILVLFLADTVMLALSDFRLVPAPEVFILAAAALLAGIAAVYRRFREAPRLAALAALGCRLVLFTNAAAVLDYLLTGLAPLPLWDARFAAADQALGLDWLGLFGWTMAHPWLNFVGGVAYNALGPEFILLVLVLGLQRDIARAEELWRNFAITALLTIGVGILLPAAGAYGFYNLPVARSTPCMVQVAALRSGAMRAINLGDTQGLVAFPSFHAALAVLCAWAARGWRGGRWILCVLNIAVIASAPVFGGHYFVDVMAGLGLAAAVVFWPRRARAGSGTPYKAAG